MFIFNKQHFFHIFVWFYHYHCLPEITTIMFFNLTDYLSNGNCSLHLRNFSSLVWFEQAFLCEKYSDDKDDLFEIISPFSITEAVLNSGFAEVHGNNLSKYDVNVRNYCIPSGSKKCAQSISMLNHARAF